MSGTIRRKRNPVAVALMGGLVLVFLVLGVGSGGRLADIFAGTHGDAVVIAGQHTVSKSEFKRIFDQQKQQYEQQSGQPLPLDLLVQSGFDQQLLAQMGQDRAFAELLRRSGVTPADSLVDKAVKTIPAFFDRVTGKFSPAQFMEALRNVGMTPQEFQASTKDELAQRHFIYAMDVGFRTPRIYTALNAMRGLENRDVTYFTMPRNAVPMPAPPTDAQLTAFMKEHASQLTIPETRVITLVRFSAKALEPSVTLDPAAVQKEFDFKRDSLSKPETRTLVQIPAKSPAQAAEAAARLARGEDPAAVAKAYGVEPINYADKPQSAIPDRQLGVAVFALKEGQAAPVQGSLGAAAVKVVKVTPGVVATLEGVRPQLEAELRAKAAEDRVYDLSQKFDDARQTGASVAQAAQKAGATAVTLGPIRADGRDQTGQRNPLLTDKILKSAFAESQGAETDLEEDGRGEYYALKVERVIPPALPSLEQARPQLTATYLQVTYIKAMQAKVDSLLARIKAGESMEAVAGSVGAHVTRQVGIQRVNVQQFQALGQDFLERLFNTKPGEAYAAAAQDGVYVAKLDAVRPGDLQLMARFTEGLRPRISEGYVRDLEAAVRAGAAQRVKVVTRLDAARAAIGVDPATIAKLSPPSGAKPATPAK